MVLNAALDWRVVWWRVGGMRLIRFPFNVRGVAAWIFLGALVAGVVFAADGFVRSTEQTPAPISRFFTITSRVPLEIQMILCNRLFGSARSVVRSRDSEPGFRWLSRPTISWNHH